jgi:glutamate synthase (NADPH/NADH) small chain
MCASRTGTRSTRRSAERCCLRTQASRCMDCGIPFCHNGCPLGNLIPEWNDLVWRDDWATRHRAPARHQQLPGVHRRLCPAPCESACVLGINQDPVTIKQVEVSIIDRAWDEGWVTPQPPSGCPARPSPCRIRSGRSGRGPAAHPRRSHGRGVRASRPDRRAAALRHPGVQDGEAHLDRRLDQMRPRGSSSAPASRWARATSPPTPAPRTLRRGRARGGLDDRRDLPVPGRELTASTRRWSSCHWPTGSSSATSRSPIHRRDRQARRDHRRR